MPPDELRLTRGVSLPKENGSLVSVFDACSLMPTVRVVPSVATDVVSVTARPSASVNLRVPSRSPQWSTARSWSATAFCTRSGNPSTDPALRPTVGIGSASLPAVASPDVQTPTASSVDLSWAIPGSTALARDMVGVNTPIMEVATVSASALTSGRARGASDIDMRPPERLRDRL